jgi:serine O-acetyltransferase
MSDMIWDTIRGEVQDHAKNEPMLASFLYSVVLNHNTLEDALSFLLATKLESPTLGATSLRDLIDEAYRNDETISNSIREDISAVCQRDPACQGYSSILLYYKGYHALQAYRAAHYYWNQNRKSLASYLQSRISEVFGVDAHPAAKIGCGILIDHATSVVIGETAVVEDNVSMLHEVTLGGTGKDTGDRHPKVRHGVLISAGAKVLGNVEIGENAKVGSGAVVLEDVPPHTTVVGVPAKVVGTPTSAIPALEMNQHIEDGGGI